MKQLGSREAAAALGGTKISYRIIWVLIVCMVAFTVVIWMLFTLAYRYAINGVMNEYVLTAASELATEIRLVVNADVGELRALATSEDVRSMDPSRLRLALTKLVNKPDTPFLSAYLMDASGAVIDYGSSSRGEDDPFGRAMLPSAALKRVLAGEVYLSGVGTVRNEDDFFPKPYWVAAIPIADFYGENVAALVGLVDMGRIQDLVAKRSLGNTGAAYVTDKEGRILVRVDHRNTMRPGLSDLVRKGIPGGVGVSISEANGVKTIYARAALANEGWGVLVGMDEAELLTGYNRLTVAVILGSVLLVGILVGVSIKRINSILAPLYDLRAAVEKVGAGDYNIRVKIDGTDEIGALAETFNSMVSKVREAERAKTEFISLASHELRTPLTSIKGYASTLLRHDVVWDDASKQEFLETINSEADRLSRLVADMLDVSRIDLGRLEFRLENLAVGDIARQVAKRVATSTDKHRFFFEVADGVPDGLGDRDRVEQVFFNLYSNAIKYSPAGGSINTSVKTANGGRFVKVSISDQGIGIADDQLNKVFDRFYRVKDQRTPEAGGSGLGLYIVKNLITAMGGDIKAESTPTKGSTFTFTLPVAESPREVPA